MALKPPPIQDFALHSDGRFRQSWLAWFRSITKEDEGYTGTFEDNTGATVTVVNGKITDVT